MSTHSSIISCLENSMDRGAWRATTHGVAESWDMTELVTLSLTLHLADTVIFTNCRFVVTLVRQVYFYHFFNSICSLVSLHHILIILVMFQAFSLLYFLWRLVVVTSMTH